MSFHQVVGEEATIDMIYKKRGLIISEATLKLSDLIQEGFRFLITHELNVELQKKVKKLFVCTDDVQVLEYSTFRDPLGIDTNEEASELWNETFFNYFNTICPKRHYFGSHEGDGACIGWFENSEEEEESEVIED